MFAAPPETCLARKFDFQHGCRVGCDAVSEAANLDLDARSQRLQALAQYPVVVTPTGVDRYDRSVRRGDPIEFALRSACRGVAWQVIHARCDYPQRARHQPRRIRTLSGVSLQIVHVTVASAGKPFVEPLRRLGNVNIGYCDVREAELCAPGSKVRCDRGQIAGAVTVHG